MAVLTLEDRIAERVRRPDFPLWRTNVETTGGCSSPVHLAGSWTVTDTNSGALLAHRAGPIMTACGTRRAALCPSCAHRYAGDAFHIVRSGLTPTGTDTAATSARSGPMVFLTLTAPSFGAVHNRPMTAAGRARPCTGCRDWHGPDDPRIGSAVDADTYDYVGAVLWQAHVTALWHRFVIALRRQLAALAGVTVRAFADHARLAYAKVAEYQARGLVHFHAIIRVDGPDGGGPLPAWATTETLTAAIRAAARLRLEPRQVDRTPLPRPDGGPLVLTWGQQIDIRPITNQPGGVSESAVASYVAKYATKGTGAAVGGLDRPIRCASHIAARVVSPHHRRMIETCWQLGEIAEYQELGLHRWAHMLGFRGHFLTKSVKYSTTFTAIRDRRRNYQATQAFSRLGVESDTVTVVNHWDFVGVGHASDAEVELAHAIGERLRAQRYCDAKGKGAIR